jgi:hypothetical protein
MALTPLDGDRDRALGLLQSTPTWIEWNGRDRSVEQRILKCLEEIGHLNVDSVIAAGRIYLRNPKGPRPYNKQTLMYLVGRYIYNVPFERTDGIETVARQSPVGTFICQPIAIDGKGGLRLIHVVGTLRGPGYEFESGFKRLEAKFGRRRLP